MSEIESTVNQVIAEFQTLPDLLTGCPKNERFTLVADAFDNGLRKLVDTQVQGKRISPYAKQIWHGAKKFLTAGELQHRAFSKPRGYAGDYLMLQSILSGTVTEHPWGTACDQYFQSLSAPQAVRNRTRVIAQAIIDTAVRHQRPIRVALIGSGPAGEIPVLQELATRANLELPPIHWLLVDIDPEALQVAAQQQLSAADTLVTCPANLLRIPRNKKLHEQLSGCDLFASAGIFDYLENEPAAEVIACLYRLLAADGRMLIFNFADHNSRAYMEWIGDWHLLYRTRDNMEAIAEQANIPIDSRKVTCEPLEVNLFLDLRK